jgi:hypothetical protein
MLAPVFPVFSRKGDQGNLAGLFNRGCHNALMFRTGARLAAWADFAIFGDIAPDKIHFFVVNRQGLICTELAILGLCKEAAFASRLRSL